jgi:hypothetical protein
VGIYFFSDGDGPIGCFSKPSGSEAAKIWMKFLLGIEMHKPVVRRERFGAVFIFPTIQGATQ